MPIQLILVIVVGLIGGNKLLIGLLIGVLLCSFNQSLSALFSDALMERTWDEICKGTQTSSEGGSIEPDSDAGRAAEISK